MTDVDIGPITTHVISTETGLKGLQVTVTGTMVPSGGDNRLAGISEQGHHGYSVVERPAAQDARLKMDARSASVERRAFRVAQIATAGTEDALDIVQDAMSARGARQMRKPEKWADWTGLGFRWWVRDLERWKYLLALQGNVATGEIRTAGV
jgi:hypothetical protein